MAGDRDDKNDGKQAHANDPLASATAFGMALASQTVQFWFGVASGLARAGQELADRNAKSNPGKPVFEADATSPVEAAKAATRTVMAEVERATKDFVEVAQQAAAPVATASVKPKPEKIKPATKAAKPTVKSAAAPATVKAEDKTVKAAAEKPAVTKAETPKVEKPVSAKSAPSKSTIMPEDFHAPKSIAKPAKPDDLKKIEGIGPKLEQLLNSLGVWTFAQIAALAPEEIAYVEDMTGLEGRVASDKWLKQAAALAKAGG